MAFHPQQLPPPPPPPPVYRNAHRRIGHHSARPSVSLPLQYAPEESTTLIYKLLSDSGLLTHQDDQYVFSKYNHTVSITQQGPTCGIVAMMMALDTLGIRIPEMTHILDIAKRLNYTYHGEMYSVSNLCKLISLVTHEVRAIHLTDLSDHKADIIDHLSSGHPILIPYDADRNHHPCELNGHHAHWAVILGFCFDLRKPRAMNFEKTLTLWEKDSNYKHMYHLKSSDDTHIFRDFFNLLSRNSRKLYLYAKQGKSCHIHLFDYDKLLASNRNLIATAPYSGRDLMIPEDGVRSGLADQAILLRPN